MKKGYKLVLDINNDEFSNKVLGLEDENIFNAVSEENAVDAMDGISDEVEEQLNDNDDTIFDDIPQDDEPEEEDNDWQPVVDSADKEDSKDPEDCVNLMELVSGYTNNYRKLFVELADDTILEGTGEFKNHPSYTELEKVFDTVTSILADTKYEAFTNLVAARDLLVDSRKMVACCGTKEAPFIYEGLQLAYIQQLHNLLMVSPYSLKLKDTFENSSEAIGLDKDIKLMNRILSDILDAAGLLGSKIRFKEATKSEITGKSNEINETVYADSDIINEGTDLIVSDFEYAGESIANLIEIKANKALLEYNLIIRDLSLLVTYLTKLDVKEAWKNIRVAVYNLINEEDSTKVEELLVETCKVLDPVLLNMNKAYKGVLKED